MKKMFQVRMQTEHLRNKKNDWQNGRQLQTDRQTGQPNRQYKRQTGQPDIQYKRQTGQPGIQYKRQTGQPDRQYKRQTCQPDRQYGLQTCRQINGHREKWTNRKMDKQNNRETS